MSRTPQDLNNATLFRMVASTTVLGVVLAAIVGISSDDWARPGSALLQSVAIIGAILLVGSFAAVLAKRFGRPGKAGFHAHVGLASLGLALVLVHWGFSIWQFPTLLLVLLAALVALGVWSRTRGAKQMAGTFGRKHAAFIAPNPAVKERFRRLIAEKRAVLAKLDRSAAEGTFSLQLRHWLTSPFRAMQYQRLCSAEQALVGADAVLSPTHRYWRLAHRLLAWGFVAGLIGHILVVTLFAGYVAEGGEIYWWHLADWNF